MATTGCSGRRRQFAVACGVLSRCIRAEAAAAAKMTAAAHHQAASRTMLLMPGADVAPDTREDDVEATPEQSSRAQLTIVYGGRVLVFDDFPADRAADLVVGLAARHEVMVPGGTKDDIPVARKASLQRFMDKRRDRVAARAPYYAARAASSSPALEKLNEEEARHQDAGCWLGLGVPGGCAC